MKTSLLPIILIINVMLLSCQSETRKADKLRLENKFEEAAILYQKAADKGDAYAMWRLSIAYEHGDGVDYDQSHAFELLKKAADAGCEEAKCDLAFSYLYGWYGLEKEPEKGKAMLDELIKTTENSYTLSRYADILLWGSNPYEEDKEKAMAILNRVKDKDNSFYCRTMGDVYYLGTDETEVNVQKAIEYFTKAFQNGQRYPAFIIQNIYAFGFGDVKADKVKRMEWLDKGIKSNSTDCMITMAQICLSDDTTFANYHNSPRGIDLLKRAAKHGSGEAYFNLGNKYIEGIHVQKDDNKAFEYWKKSAELGYSGGYSNLAWAYINGIGCEKDIIKGIETHKKAVENGSGHSAKTLYSSYFYGWNGVDIDLELAKHYLFKAAELGDAEGRYILGLHYYYGSTLVNTNTSQAFSYVKQAADMGYIDACKEIAYFYENGIGCDKNPTKAKEYRDKTIVKDDKKE